MNPTSPLWHHISIVQAIPRNSSSHSGEQFVEETFDFGNDRNNKI